MSDGLRLCLGLLTIVPVRTGVVDRPTARASMLLAPVVGVGLGAAAWAVGAGLHGLGASGPLAGVGAVAMLAVLTRGLHLDGLADLADGLGSARPASGALEVMHRSDVGPFGVVTLVLVLLVQVAALGPAFDGGYAASVLLTGVVTGRLALPWACRVGVPAARPEGLGVLVAGSVPVAAAAVSTALWLLVGVGAGLLVAPAAGSLPAAVAPVLGVVAGLTAAQLLLRRATRRLGGVTGDVLGAVVETATTAALLVAALALAPRP